MLVPSDDGETISESELKRRRRGSMACGEVEMVATSSHSRPEHALSSTGQLPLEGSSSICQSFWDSSYRHVAHNLAHNIF